ncbi:ABC transporter ATP-binding protein [Tritonibacter mobilis]|uniref:ABC transporter ATP-binding protein n=1 Tax=Tritonibacter mobilis TaxID=379347 RepID=UPI0022A8255E
MVSAVFCVPALVPSQTFGQPLPHALEATGVADLADRDVDELSGGQRQKVWIAMALAQETGILLLDEPTTYLDINHQIEVLDLLVDLNRKRGTTIVMVLHDLNLAARYSDQLAALVAGKIDVMGPPKEVLTSTMVQRVFGLSCTIVEDPVSQRPMMLPIGRHFADAIIDRDEVC